MFPVRFRNLGPWLGGRGDFFFLRIFWYFFIVLFMDFVSSGFLRISEVFTHKNAFSKMGFP